MGLDDLVRQGLDGRDRERRREAAEEDALERDMAAVENQMLHLGAELLGRLLQMEAPRLVTLATEKRMFSKIPRYLPGATYYEIGTLVLDEDGVIRSCNWRREKDISAPYREAQEVAAAREGHRPLFGEVGGPRFFLPKQDWGEYATEHFFQENGKLRYGMVGNPAQSGEQVIANWFRAQYLDS